MTSVQHVLVPVQENAAAAYLGKGAQVCIAVRFQLFFQHTGLETFGETWSEKFTLLLGLVHGKNRVCCAHWLICCKQLSAQLPEKNKYLLEKYIVLAVHHTGLVT